MKLALFIILSFLALSLSAQEAEIQGNSIEIGAYQVNNTNKLSGVKIKGSPYSNEVYVPAKVNDIKKTHAIRLNIVTNSLEVKISDSKSIILDSNNNFDIQLVDGSNRKFKTIAYPDENLEPMKAVLEVIAAKENYTLYKRERKIFVEARKGGTYTDKKPAEYVSIPPIYYIAFEKNQAMGLVEISRKKKNFFALFEKYGKQVGQFAKKEKLSISENNDIVEILDFYFQVKK